MRTAPCADCGGELAPVKYWILNDDGVSELETLWLCPVCDAMFKEDDEDE